MGDPKDAEADEGDEVLEDDDTEGSRIGIALKSPRHPDRGDDTQWNAGGGATTR